MCDACGMAGDLDLRMKPRDPEASVRVVLRDFRCPRCNGHGRPRVTALSSETPVWRRQRLSVTALTEFPATPCGAAGNGSCHVQTGWFRRR
jgi:hypothetical protein